jgi:hypothetical protein
VTSTATSSGHPVMTKSSSSTTLMRKKRRYARRITSVPKLHLLLLQGSQPQPPPPLTPMKHPGGCKKIIVVIAPPIGKLMVAATTETKPVYLRLPHQGGACGRRASRRTSMVLSCYSISSFVQRSEDDDAKSLMYFHTLHASCRFSVSVMPLM